MPSNYDILHSIHYKCYLSQKNMLFVMIPHHIFLLNSKKIETKEEGNKRVEQLFLFFWIQLKAFLLFHDWSHGKSVCFAEYQKHKIKMPERKAESIYHQKYKRSELGEKRGNHSLKSTLSSMLLFLLPYLDRGIDLWLFLSSLTLLI